MTRVKMSDLPKDMNIYCITEAHANQIKEVFKDLNMPWKFVEGLRENIDKLPLYRKALPTKEEEEEKEMKTIEGGKKKR